MIGASWRPDAWLKSPRPGGIHVSVDSSSLAAAPRRQPKRPATPVAVALLSGLAVSSCADTGSAGTPRMNLITGSTGSSWYRIGAAIAERTNQGLDGHPVSAVPGAGGISNPARVGLAPGDFGMAFLPFIRSAYRGAPPYQQAFPDLRHVATLTQNKFHVIVAQESPVAGLEDLRRDRLAVRIGTGPPGSGEEFLLRESLSAYGVSYDDIRDWGGRLDLMGSVERTDQFRDHHIDLIVFNINEPAAIVTQLMLTRPTRFLPISDDVRQELESDWEVRVLDIPANTYPNQAEAVPTVGLVFGIFTTADLGEDIVYHVTRTVAENKRYLDTVHPGFRSWEPRDMIENAGVPTHLGALRYYTERGWIK